MDIIFVSAEAAPWSKTGGLGDVVGSLPIALAQRGHRVMVVTPRWGCLPLLCSKSPGDVLQCADAAYFPARGMAVGGL